MTTVELPTIPPTPNQRPRHRTRISPPHGSFPDDVHSLVDDHSRLAYSEILPEEKSPTCAAFLQRAIACFATHGMAQIERLMTDNAWAYRYSLREVSAAHGIKQKFIKDDRRSTSCYQPDGRVHLGGLRDYLD